MKKVCILGCGAAGFLLLYTLEKNGISPEQVIVIDPSLNGGDLSSKWCSVRSNTTWQQLLTAVPYNGPLPSIYAAIDPTQPCPLRYYIQYLRDVTKAYLQKCEVHSTYATKTSHENGQWNITLKHQQTPLVADILLLATGSEPKHLDLPYPSISLCVALDKEKLSSFVQKGNHILVFGTAHSATLIVQNLLDLGATVTNFYASQKPFYFDRDGDYDGLKQDAARIADKILAKEIPVSLVSVQDTAAVIRHTKNVDAVIYAIGFEARNPFGLKDYNGETGQIEGVPHAWGFGIAYPKRAADGIHWDVSIPAFQGHIEQQMPNIVSLLRLE
jgi:cation diffusion facilitator CzcD-associated flavoprotein CzcO